LLYLAFVVLSLILVSVMATTPRSTRRPRASFPYAQSDPTTPLAKYSERRPDLYSLSATHAFDWEAARGNRPPPFTSAVGYGSSESLRKKIGRAAVEDGVGDEGATPAKTTRKRIVRKKPWRQRCVAETNKANHVLRRYFL
jgi:hypothetical protein